MNLADVLSKLSLGPLSEQAAFGTGAGTITNTSVACKVITGQATDLMVGGVHLSVLDTTPAAGTGPKTYTFATDKVACSMGGSDTTKGGVVGSRLRLEATALLQWTITGVIIGAGTIATPAATS